MMVRMAYFLTGGMCGAVLGFIVAIILQIFYNFILSRIERLTTQMEESAITLLDIIMKHKLSQG